jgi:hypothetical protein
MLIAAPTNWPWSNYLVEEDGSIVAEIEGAMWREQAAATVGKQTFAFYREGIFTANYVMQRGGQIAANAQKPGVLNARLDVTWGDRSVTVRKNSIWTQTFAVTSDGSQIGIIRPAGVFKRRGIFDGASEIPLEIRVFVLWIVLMMWKRQN